MKLLKKDNIQFYPATKRIVPNFKLIKVVSNLSQDKYNRMVIDGSNRKITEKKNHKKIWRHYYHLQNF